jgi:hypothetical protein
MAIDQLNQMGQAAPGFQQSDHEIEKYETLAAYYIEDIPNDIDMIDIPLRVLESIDAVKGLGNNIVSFLSLDDTVSELYTDESLHEMRIGNNFYVTIEITISHRLTLYVKYNLTLKSVIVRLRILRQLCKWYFKLFNKNLCFYKIEAILN